MWSSTFLDEAGRPSFNLLQNYGSAGAPLIYYVFDVLVVSGRDVMSEPLVRRREILRDEVLAQLGEPIRESPVLDASLRDLMTAARAQGLKGLVAKRLQSAYEPGKRSGAWQKMRLNQGQELVIGAKWVCGQHGMCQERSFAQRRALPCHRCQLPVM